MGSHEVMDDRYMEEMGRLVSEALSSAAGLKALAAEERDEMAGWIPEAYETVGIALDRFKSIMDTFEEEILHIGNFPSLHMGLVNEEGEMDLYDGRLRIVDSEGNIVADGLKPWR
jgi:NAD-reducing hydrogenase large subunit